MYCAGLGLTRLGGFADHDGFSGVMLGDESLSWHLEFTFCHHHPVEPATTAEDLLVLYLPDEEQWQRRCSALVRAGFEEVAPLNPYWAKSGATFQDRDRYRVVVQNSSWKSRMSVS